jgi:hypothetical protein
MILSGISKSLDPRLALPSADDVVYPKKTEAKPSPPEVKISLDAQEAHARAVLEAAKSGNEKTDADPKSRAVYLPNVQGLDEATARQTLNMIQGLINEAQDGSVTVIAANGFDATNSLAVYKSWLQRYLAIAK